MRKICKTFNFYFFASIHIYNLFAACDCNVTGSVNSSSRCDRVSGQCSCKPGVTARRCDQCMIQHTNFSDSGCDGKYRREGKGREGKGREGRGGEGKGGKEGGREWKGEGGEGKTRGEERRGREREGNERQGKKGEK